MHKLLFIFLLGLACTSVTRGQTKCDKTVSGKVLDIASNEPLPYVSVRVTETNTGVVTDQQGNFNISGLCEDEIHLEFTYVGYKKVVHHHDFHHDIPTILMAEEQIALEGIVVEGEQVRGGTKTLSPEVFRISELQKFGNADMADLANVISGLSVVNTGQNVQKPTLHGLSGNRILLIQQGIRYEYQSWGDDHAPGIDPGSSSSVEVIKGAGTVKYGPEAMGGVVIFNPEPLGLHQPLKVTTQLSGHSNGKGMGGRISAQQGFDHWSVMLNGSGNIHGDLSTPDYLLTNTGKKVWNVGTGVLYHKANTDIEAFFSHNNQNLGILRGSVTGNLEDLAFAMGASEPLYTSDFSYLINTPRQEVVHDMASVKGTYYQGGHVFDLKYSWQLNQRKEFDIRRGANNELPSIDLRLTTHTLDFNWDHPVWNGLDGESGLSWLYHDNDNQPGTNTIPFLPNYNDSRFGVYAIESKKYGNQTVEMGLRYDVQFTSIRGRQINNNPYYNDLVFQNLTASLGYKLKMNDQLDFNTNLGTSWKSPDVSELYGFGKHGAIIQYGLWRYEDSGESNINTSTILDQTSKPVNNEVGYKWINQLKWTGDRSDWIISGYAHVINNYIFATPRGITTTSRGAFPYFIYRQTNALIAGVDAEMSYMISKDMTITSNASFVYARDTRYQNYFVEIPPLNIHSQLRKNIKGKWLNHHLELDLSYTFQKKFTPGVITPEDILEASANGDQLFETSEEIFDFMSAPTGYFLVDLGWETSWKGYSLSLKAENLMNNTYRVYTDRIRYFAADTGINFIISIKYSL
ncbi:MAG: TonB-dependent receptor [Cyclobacteriaceae bacterium]|nr:TonB-dependent receptor [Cyclobacteriaceae bacterium SS2]